MSSLKGQYIKQSLAWIGVILFATFAIVGACTTTGKPNITDEPGQTQEQTTETKVEKKTEAIPHDTKTVEDSSLEYGKTKVRTTGVDGVKTYTYNVTYENGKETKRELVSTEITKEAVDEVIAKGTKIKWTCVDVTSYDYNWNNDMLCTSSTGERRYTSYEGARALENQ